MKSVLVLVLVHGASCAFFDLTDVDDPLSLLWQTNKDFTATPKNSPCIVPVPSPGGLSVTTGQCRHKTLCLLSGGQSHLHDNCGSFLTCCTQSGICTKRTKAKVSYFTNEGTNFAADCEYIVEAHNEHVCQVRLDFEQFHLSPSRNISVNSTHVRRECIDDYLTVTPNIYNIPRLCGFNDGQHVYVELHSLNEVRLHVHLSDRNGIYGNSARNITIVPNPRWRIRVTQIECPRAKDFFMKNKVYGLESDLRLLAPEGATQYFIERRGRIRSFGFDGRNGDEYTSGLNYAIAFKRRPDVNCIWFTTNYITLRHTNDTLTATTPTSCIDFLFVPDFTEVGGIIYRYGSKLCSVESDPNRHPQIFYLNAPGPFTIFFHSARAFTQDTAAIPVTDTRAFDITYEMRNC